MGLEQKIYEVGAVTSPNGEVNGKIALVNEAGDALFTTSGLVVSGDVRMYVGAGAPVDYTDGTPPATGEGEAGIGSLYTNTTTGKLYVNKGTKAQPLWGIVTSA